MRAAYGFVGLALAAASWHFETAPLALVGVVIAVFGFGQALIGVCIFHAAKGTCDMR